MASRDTHPPSPTSRSAWQPTLLSVAAASLLAGLAGSAINTAWILTTRPVLRPRTHIEILVMARHMARWAGVELAALLPASLGLAMDPRYPLQVALFMSHALLAGAVLALFISLAAWAGLKCLALATRMAHRGQAFKEWDLPIWLPFLVGVAPALYGPLRSFTQASGLSEHLNPLAWLLVALVFALVSKRHGAPPLFLIQAGGGLALLAALGGLMLHSFFLGRGPACDFAGACPDAGEQPNIILISIDSLRPDHLGCYGYPRATSPNIDQIAAEGAMFRSVVAPSTWTLPSHLSLLTGRAVEERYGDILSLRADLGIETLAETLRQSGYATAGFVSAPYLDSRYGYAQGFDTYDDYSIVAASNPESHQGVTSPQLMHLAETWLDRWQQKEEAAPFFMFLHLWDVHYDYIPPPPYDTLFDSDYQGSISGENFHSNPQVHADMDSRDLQHLVALYDGEIAWTDMHIGRLMDRLQAMNVHNNTVVAVTSDHGDEFFEHGRKGHRENLYDTTLMAALVLRYPPAVNAGTIVENQIRLMDIAPTLLALAGKPPAVESAAFLNPGLGLDLSPLMAADQPPGLTHRTAFADLLGTQAALRNGRHKLILSPQTGAMELYDLQADPAELDDRSTGKPQQTQQMIDLLLAWREGLDLGDMSGPVPDDNEHRQRLRSLGYID